MQDVAAMPELSAWQRLALSHGYRSVIALPLFLDEDDFGVLAIYSSGPMSSLPTRSRS